MEGINMTVQETLQYYLVERGSTNDKRLLRGKALYFGEQKLTLGRGIRFRCLYRVVGRYPHITQKIAIGMLPTGDVLYDVNQLVGVSSRAYYMIVDWVNTYTTATGRTYDNAGQSMEVRRVSLPEFNLLTRGSRGSGRSFSNFLESNLVTEV
jgi:hypothetical protein